MTGRQHKFLQHKGLQILYWRGSKEVHEENTAGEGSVWYPAEDHPSTDE